MSDKFITLGLDLETSGSTHDRHVPIQIGIYVDAHLISEYIGGWDWNEWEWDEEAEEVHGIPKETLQSHPPVNIVDGGVAARLWHLVKEQRMNRIPVGWNVAGFDMPFVRRWMPLTASLLSYRSLDLNAICFYLDGLGGKTWKDHKRAAKQYANAFIDASQRHDAGEDAKAAIYELHYLREVGFPLEPPFPNA